MTYQASYFSDRLQVGASMVVTAIGAAKASTQLTTLVDVAICVSNTLQRRHFKIDRSMLQGSSLLVWPPSS